MTGFSVCYGTEYSNHFKLWIPQTSHYFIIWQIFVSKIIWSTNKLHMSRRTRHTANMWQYVMNIQCVTNTLICNKYSSGHSMSKYHSLAPLKTIFIKFPKYLVCIWGCQAASHRIKLNFECSFLQVSIEKIKVLYPKVDFYEYWDRDWVKCYLRHRLYITD